MPPQPRLAIIATIQQAITELLTTYEPEFLRFGYSLFLAFATILIAWHGIRMMLSHEGLGDHLFGFAKLLLFISFGYALIAFYEAPIPGIGVSFSNLITDQTHHFATVLDARSLEVMFDHLDDSGGSFRAAGRLVDPRESPVLADADRRDARQSHLSGDCVVRPDCQRRLRFAWPNFRAVLHRPQARLAVLVLAEGVHPGTRSSRWLSFAFLMIFERFVFNYLTTLPPGITEDLYLVYGLQSLVVVGTFVVGILLVPSLTSSIFSGQGGQSILPERLRMHF